MESWVFNLVGQLTAVRDAVISRGPTTLRVGADILARLESAMRNAAGYIELISPMAQFTTAGTTGAPPDLVAGPGVQEQLDKLKALKAEFEAELAYSESQVPVYHDQLRKAQEHKIQAGIMDWVNKINPETRKYILGTAIQIINSVLQKSGIPITLPTPAAPAADKKGK